MGRNDEHMDKKIELVSRGFNSESHCQTALIKFLLTLFTSLRRP